MNAQAAFGTDPGAPVRVRAGVSPHERWLVAVAMGGQGHYAAAAAVLQRLLADARVPATVAAHAAVTLAAHRRQLGGHAEARPLDALGLRLAASAGAPRPLRAETGDPELHPGWDALAARIDALVGLAADALGTGDPERTRRLLDVAEKAAAGHPSWRPRARIGWVRAESALLRGDAEAAVAPAQDALDLAVRGGSTRHVIKSRIVLAVAMSVAGGNAADALAELDAAGNEAERLGLLPLVWPARMAAADLVQEASGGPSNANERRVRSADLSTTILSGDAARRRHAGITTLSVIERRCDPGGRLLMGERRVVPAGLRVM
jgi:hypothetical protein